MKRTFLAVLMAATMILAASCDKDNGNNNPPEETADPKVTDGLYRYCYGLFLYIYCKSIRRRNCGMDGSLRR